MRCLNSPSILNSLEAKIVETVPADARHVLVINAGDGRIGRAVREKLGAGGTVSLVTLQPGLHRLVDDFSGAGTSAWDLDWYSARVQQHGAFDVVVVYQLHEFWRGELYQFQRVLKLAKPGAIVWASFLNAQASRLIARFLPPVRLGFSALADPVRAVTNVDFASFMDLANRIGGGILELWGMLDQNAQEFCQKPPAKPVQWESRGVKVSVGTFADAYLWGAAAVGIGFQLKGGPAVAQTPKVSFSPYSSNLLQALVLPYPDVQTREGMLAAAAVEVDAWKLAPSTETVGNLTKFALDQVGETDKPKKVLLVGSGWGRDLLVLKRNYPAWEWVGFERDRELAALGREVVEAGGVKVETADFDAALPFADNTFDVALSLGQFSSLYEPAAKQLAKEVRRVTKGTIHHLEDGRGPDQGMQLKTYSLKGVYSELGADAAVQPVLVDGNPTGMYLVKVAARA